MDASIIVCTYNRADSLRDTLAALKNQNAASITNWEVIVVDNNSKDNTRHVVEQAQCDWPLLRYTFEAKQGLSHARNHGIFCAYGDIILFTDDDVLPEPDWLASTLAGIAKYQADACGGYIAPLWESPRPSWLTERFYGFLAIRTDSTDDYQIINSSQAPYGANMAFKKNVFEKIGLFDTRRGRMGNVLASGEDIEMFERVLATGLKVFFLGKCRVHHKVESFRLTKRYFRKWRFQTSRNRAVSQGLIGKKRFLNVPFYIFPQLFRALSRYAFATLTKTEDHVFSTELIVWHYFGIIDGLLSTRKNNDK